MTTMVRDKLFDVSNEVVAITGIGGQLGYEYALGFLERGAKVLGLDVAASERTTALQEKFGGQVQMVTCDITSRAQLLGALAASRTGVGEPTVLVNNAAIDSPPSAPISENGPFEEYPESSWDRVLSVNLKGTFLCCQVFGAAMATSGNGSIINVSSTYGVVSPDQSLYQYRRDRGEVFFKPVAYSASKSGLLNLTRYLAVYWAKRGVRVNTLTIAGVENRQDPQFLTAYSGRIPIGRMARFDEYVGAVLFLASAGSCYMTGANLVIDGGWTAI